MHQLTNKVNDVTVKRAPLGTPTKKRKLLTEFPFFALSLS